MGHRDLGQHCRARAELCLEPVFNIRVADTGRGILEQERTRIFEQFHQVDSSNTKAKGGTGLGLAIAKQIVEMLVVGIWVESAVGKGSTFQMEIPHARRHYVTKPYSPDQLSRLMQGFIGEMLVRFVGPLSRRHVNEMNFGFGS